MKANIKIAIIHDWLVTYAGAERALENILKIFPASDLYSVVDFIPLNQREFLKNKRVQTSFIQNLPFSKKKYRQYLPLMPLAIRQWDLSKYDLILSSSHAVAKGVQTKKRQLHISYVYSPMRYAWDLRKQYLEETNLNKGIKGLVATNILNAMQKWDKKNTAHVNHLIAISKYIAQRINNNYKREAAVIYPPVDVEAFNVKTEKEDYYLTASRMVPYKRMDLIVEAFSLMPDKKLVVIGDGPDFNKVKAKASANVTLLGYQDFSNMKNYLERAKAFIFAAEEDFGIIVVEAQACGTPVIALGKGGALETVRGLEETEPTGVFFEEQTVESLIRGIKEFEGSSHRILPENCRKNSLQFNTSRFHDEFSAFVEKKWLEFMELGYESISNRS